MRPTPQPTVTSEQSLPAAPGLAARPSTPASRSIRSRRRRLFLTRCAVERVAGAGLQAAAARARGSRMFSPSSVHMSIRKAEVSSEVLCFAPLPLTQSCSASPFTRRVRIPSPYSRIDGRRAHRRPRHEPCLTPPHHRFRLARAAHRGPKNPGRPSRSPPRERIR
jgi:hypothetical protein